MNFYYYVFENISNSNSYLGDRIIAIPQEVGVIPFKDADGPFTSIRNLKRNSRKYKAIARQSSTKAQKILKESNIIKVKKDILLTSRTQGYPMEFIEVFEHTIRGQIEKRKVFGIHYFDNSNMRIRELLQKENDSGVWIAKIDYFDKRLERWIEKDKETSFFPLNWTLNDLFHECFYAYKNMIKDPNRINIYLATTKSGIKVELVIKEGKLKSIYPIY